MRASGEAAPASDAPGAATAAASPHAFFALVAGVLLALATSLDAAVAPPVTPLAGAVVGLGGVLGATG